MQFIRKSNWFKVVRITGPAHNLLALEFCQSGPAGELQIEALPLIGNAQVKLEAEEVRLNAIAGVAEANREFGTSYTVKRIQFVPNDTPPAEAYRYLAHAIVERRYQQPPFVETA